jgi:hypothetical protein
MPEMTPVLDSADYDKNDMFVLYPKHHQSFLGRWR